MIEDGSRLTLSLGSESFFRTDTLTGKSIIFKEGHCSASTLDKEVFKSVMPVGNYSALSTEFNLMVKCQVIRPSEEVMTLSTPSSPRPEPESTSQDVSSST